MASFTLCVNQSCPLKYKCLRYTATPEIIGQSYAMFRCMTKIGSNEPYCEYFKPIINENEIQ